MIFKRLLSLFVILILSACAVPADDGVATAVLTLPAPTVTGSPTATLIPITPTSEPLATQSPTPSAEPTEPPPTSSIEPTSTEAPEIWQSLAKMRISRSEMSAILFDGRIYVPGGFANGYVREFEKTFEVYDIASDQWSRLADVPFEVNHYGWVEFDGFFYLFPDRKQPVLRYDPMTDTWAELSSMPENRWAGTAVTLGEFIYYVGGAGGSKALLRYDPQNDSWTSLAELNQPREHLQAVVLNGEIFALGGRWQTGLKQVEIYSPDKDTWRPAPSMKQPRSGFGAAVWEGQIIVGGGELLSPLNIIDTIELYDPMINRWQLAEFSLPNPLHGFPFVVENGDLYLVGGSGIAGDISNRGQLYKYQPTQ